MNKITLSGMPSDIKFSHEAYKEKFYEMRLTSTRQSGITDVLPCVVPEVFVKDIEIGKPIKIVGSIRTLNKDAEDGRCVLSVYVFVEELLEYEGQDVNRVEFDGYICKEPKYRETPLGRQITDINLACQRQKVFKSDYIPTICWGRAARAMALADVGTHIQGNGRLQSRIYTKNIGDVEEERTAYELSVINVEECEEGDKDEN